MEPGRQSPRLTTVRLLLVVLLTTTAACATSEPSAAPTAPSATQRETPATSSDSSAATKPPDAESWTVPRAEDVLGQWRVVSVEGKEAPSDTRRSLTMFQRDGMYWATWDDGLNGHSVRWSLTATGAYRARDAVSSAVGCIDATCAHPSGFGVSHASGLRLTADDHLVFLNHSGSELARYSRRN